MIFFLFCIMYVVYVQILDMVYVQILDMAY